MPVLTSKICVSLSIAHLEETYFSIVYHSRTRACLLRATSATACYCSKIRIRVDFYR